VPQQGFSEPEPEPEPTLEVEEPEPEPASSEQVRCLDKEFELLVALCIALLAAFVATVFSTV
jgi:hypothetical protein